MFEKECFIEECRALLRETKPQAAIRELVARAVSEPARVERALGAPRRAGVETVYKADDLTILNLCWGPGMKIHPHNHEMWAVIGIYGGREDNVFYRRNDGGLTQHGTKEMNAGDAILLGTNIIHAVTNPLDRFTCAIHVYGGNFFATPRSEWDPKTMEEHPYDVAHTLRAFEESNARIAQE